jgi:4-hydroxy-4-methyl-2-oxoglutarate aldolase
LAVINKRVERVSKAIIEEFKKIGVGDIGHILEASSFMDPGIRPVYRDVKLVGPALTARMLPGDNTLNRKVIELVEPGDVIVIDRCGDKMHACWGGALSLFCKVKGVAGLIIDGSTTDSMEITDMKWPVFSRALSGLLGRRLDKGGGINIPVQCGGAVVHPGDLIVADDDGIAVIDPEGSEELLKKLQERFRGTPSIRQWIADGKPLKEHPNANLLGKK